MKAASLLVCAVLSSGAVLRPAVVEASPITYNYTGTVTGATGIFLAQGPSVSGTFTFDTTLLDSNPANNIDVFDAGLAGNVGANASWNATLTNGAVSLSTATNANVAGSSHHFLEIVDDPLEDRFRFETLVFAPSDDSIRIILRDLTPSPPDGISVGSNNLTGTVAGAIALANSLNPGLFGFSATQSFWFARGAGGLLDGQLNFTVTSITPAAAAAPVPEPTSLLLLGTGLIGAGVRRHRQRRSRR